MNNRYVTQMFGLSLGSGLEMNGIKFENRRKKFLDLDTDLSLGSEDMPYDVLSVYALARNIGENELLDWAKEVGVVGAQAQSIQDIDAQDVISFLSCWESVCGIIERRRS